MKRIDLIINKNHYIAVYRHPAIICWKPIKLPFWSLILTAPLRNGLAHYMARKKCPPNCIFQYLTTSLTTGLLRQ